MTLPTQEQAKQACEFAAREVIAPAFFEKLASYNIVPKTEQEAEQLVQLADTLEQGERAGLTKASHDAGNPFLAHVLQETQRQLGTNPQHVDAQIKSAAQQITEKNEVARNAMLIFSHIAAGGAVQEQ